ncbi:hypothetical protein KI387_040810 [Taxus chinensis]|uniref:Pentatricopeptide repeat-containing protein n=1 Tax=Taxus chinensis TaxID=29808 RepID=A0AA38C7G2_TAXCH|nr:hypothetical protein KI387_040810 [Taxus chinensis]
MSSTALLNQNLRALCRNGGLKEAIHILLTAHNSSVDSSTYYDLLQACIDQKALNEGKQIHSHINDRDFTFATHTFLQNKLINMYDKCGSLPDARNIFDSMTEPNVFSWNMIISAYRRHGFSHQAFTLFYQMQRTAVHPDQFTFSSILPVCTNAGSLKHGLQIHGRIIRCGFQSDVIVMNTLIDMYAKCGSLHKARTLFDKMPQRNIVSWTAMITGHAQIGVIGDALRFFEEMPQQDVVSWTAMIVGYAQNGLVNKALELLKQMESTGVKPDSSTFASILPACAKIGALEQGRKIHQRIVECGLFSDVVVITALIDMYAKCGNICKAQELFDEMPQRNVVSWNVMIVGYAQKGLVEKAFGDF